MFERKEITINGSPYHLHSLSVPGGIIYEFWTYQEDSMECELTKVVFVPEAP